MIKLLRRFSRRHQQQWSHPSSCTRQAYVLLCSPPSSPPSLRSSHKSMRSLCGRRRTASVTTSTDTIMSDQVSASQRLRVTQCDRGCACACARVRLCVCVITIAGFFWQEVHNRKTHLIGTPPQCQLSTGWWCCNSSKSFVKTFVHGELCFVGSLFLFIASSLNNLLLPLLWRQYWDFPASFWCSKASGFLGRSRHVTKRKLQAQSGNERDDVAFKLTQPRRRCHRSWRHTAPFPAQTAGDWWIQLGSTQRRLLGCKYCSKQSSYNWQAEHSFRFMSSVCRGQFPSPVIMLKSHLVCSSCVCLNIIATRGRVCLRSPPNNPCTFFSPSKPPADTSSLDKVIHEQIKPTFQLARRVLAELLQSRSVLFQQGESDTLASGW